jgi:hypothetical protein
VDKGFCSFVYFASSLRMYHLIDIIRGRGNIHIPYMYNATTRSKAAIHLPTLPQPTLSTIHYAALARIARPTLNKAMAPAAWPRRTTLAWLVVVVVDASALNAVTVGAVVSVWVSGCASRWQLAWAVAILSHSCSAWVTLPQATAQLVERIDMVELLAVQNDTAQRHRPSSWRGCLRARRW